MDIQNLTLCELANAIVSGDVTSMGATSTMLHGLETVGRALNCVVTIAAEEALAQAEAADEDRRQGRQLGSLHGVPIANKDVFDVVGRIATAGSGRRLGEPAKRSADVIEKMTEAGAINLGSLHMSEFAMSPLGFNASLGPCLNPWDARRVPGGSSSGSAVAVAARLVPASLGTDTGGSVRIPSGACGVACLKPSRGRVATRGVFPLAKSLDCVGPIARTARDCARLLDIISADSNQESAEAGLEMPVSGLRLGYAQSAIEETTPEVGAAILAAIDVLHAAGLRAAPALLKPFEDVIALNTLILNVEAAAVHRQWFIDNPKNYSQHLRSRIEPGLNTAAAQYADALAARESLSSRFVAETFRSADVLILPCLPADPPTIEDEFERQQGCSQTNNAIVRYTRALNYLGVPAASIPIGFSRAGLPISLQIVAAPGRDALALRVAHAFQMKTDWHRRAPSLLHLAGKSEGLDRNVAKEVRR